MIVTYIRSSSYGAWDFCEHRYLMEYVLGIKGRGPNNKADKGSIVHKALELLAWKKKCEQDNKLTFTDNELKKEFVAAEVEPEMALQHAYAYYSDPANCPHPWKPSDLSDCRNWLVSTLNCNDGMFNPLKRHVVNPEQYFDMVIDEPWARYNYVNPQTGEKMVGQLAIKGTIDLVTEAEPGILEYLDWKTGKRWDWGNDREKTYKKLCRDPQLLLYFYALKKLYPQYENIFVTIFFCQDGGPFSICFDDAHIKMFLEMLRRRFEAIKNTQKPQRIINNGSKKWKCKSLCSFGKDKQPGTDITQCEYIHQELLTLGLDRVVQKHGKAGAFKAYGDGGGQSNREGSAE